MTTAQAHRISELLLTLRDIDCGENVPVDELETLAAAVVRRECETCSGLGFLSGAHTDRVNPCPTCKASA
jgi:hypothetical protein